MRFGLRLVQQLGTPAELVRYAVLAEEVGFDQVWFSHDPFLYHGFALASAAAAATRRVGVGVLGCNPYTMDPSEIATWIATLDELSEGRALLGLGLHTEEMVRWIGYDTSDLLPRTAEAVARIRRLLVGGTVADMGPAKGPTFHGPWHWTEQAHLRFVPRRRTIPIYLCAFGEEYLGLAGAIGDGAMPMLTPPAAAKLMVERVRAGAQGAGWDPETLEIAGCLWLSLGPERAEAAAKLRSLVAYFGPYLEAAALGTIGLGPEDFAPLKFLMDSGYLEAAQAAVSEPMLRLGLVGTPEEVTEAVFALGEAGVTQANLGGPLGPDPELAIRLMGEQVIPRFR